MNTQGALETALLPHKQDFLQLRGDLARREGRYPFPSLFDLHGRLIAALRLHTRFGDVWGILKTDDPSSAVVSNIQESQAAKSRLARERDASKGIYVGYVLAPAIIETRYRRPIVVRIDGGFNRHVEVLDNGKGEVQDTWYMIIEELHSL